ncbi:MAG: STAS/SEC14 domain-containing protein [Cupriavidus sp.]|nr:STAS/SEC14 domain-containing protein [Cupriavidus sp.]
MIKTLDGFPGNVVAVHANGKLTREDYEKVLIPAVDAALADREKVRMYYELGPDFTVTSMEPGAMWDDFKLGVSHFLRWEGIAVVTDHDWVRHTINVFRFLVPGHVRTFTMSQSQEARDWIVSQLAKPTSLS